MSLVGPRPHPVEDCAQYSSEHCRRLGVKPGVTGLWQVMARTNPCFEICMMLDLAYIEKWSLLLDCRILLKTVPAVFSGEGQ
jgi:lipopolysaccharide/colanic/teichoic acid biosynthesis glycosyltransferase